MRKVSRFMAVLMLAALLAACSGGSKGTEPTTPPAGGSPSSGSDGQSGQPKAGGTLRFATLRAANSFDPHVSGGISNNWLLGSLYSTLVEYDVKGDLVGALAESWTQENDTTYTFTLRKGVTFHDGSELDAADVVASIDRIRDPDTAAARKAVVDNIAKTEAVDSHTVRMTLKEADATFLHALASNASYIVSSTDVANGFDFKAKANGTGPFTLDTWESERQYVLKKNPGFWKPGLPYLDGVVLTVTTDEKARVDVLRSGEADLAEYVPWQEMASLEQDGFKVIRHFGLQSFVRLNTHRTPVDNKKVRQALAYVIDRQAVIDLAFGGQGQVISGPLQPEGSPFYVKEHENYYTKDWDKAKQLLKEAGYNSPADVPPLEFQVSVSAVSNQPGKVILQQLQDFGLTVEWKTVDVPTLFKNRAEGTYQVHMDGGGMSWPDPDYLRQIFHSEFGTTYAKGVQYKHEQLDKLLEQGARVSDLAERKRIYKEAEKIILDEVPWIFVLWRPQAEAHADYVKGYQAHPSGLGGYNVSRLEQIWLDN